MIVAKNVCKITSKKSLIKTGHCQCFMLICWSKSSAVVKRKITLILNYNYTKCQQCIKNLVPKLLEQNKSKWKPCMYLLGMI